MHRKQYVKDDQHVTFLGSGSESHTPDNSPRRTLDNLHVAQYQQSIIGTQIEPKQNQQQENHF